MSNSLINLAQNRLSELIVEVNSAGELPITSIPNSSKPTSDTWERNSSQRLVVKLRYDRCGGATRRKKAQPYGHVKACKSSLGHGRQLRRAHRPLRRCHGECSQLALTHQRLDVGSIAEQHSEPSSKQIRNSLRHATVRHVLDIDTGHGFEQRAGEMVARSYTARAECELAGLCPRERDQL